MAKNTIEVKLLGDNKDLKRALDGSAGDVETFGSKAGRAFRNGAIALTAMGAGAAVVIPQLLNSGATLEAIGVKSATVFGDSLEDVQSWATGVAGSMGLTDTELVGAAASFGDLLKPMGFTADEAANMSTEMLDLSGALSAWSGGQVTATDAADVLSKAMLGEREGLKALGISISEADVQARLAQKGQEDLTGAALEQAKALATQELILEKSTDAQTAWTDGSFDGIKAQNEASAAVSTLKEEFVKGIYPALQKLIPIVQRVATWVGANLPAAFAFAGSAIAGVQTAIGWIGDNLNIVLPLLVGFGIAVTAALVPAFVAWTASATAAAVATLAAAAPFIAVGVAIAAVAAGFVWAYQNVDWFRDAVDKTWQVLQGAFAVALDVGKKGVDLLWGAIETAVDWLKTAWDESEGLRSLIAGGLKLAFDAAKKYIDIWRLAITTAVTWVQTAWTKTENLRSLLASGLKAAFDAAKIYVDTMWKAIQTAASWLQSAWTKTENLRSLLADGFKTAFDAAKGYIDTMWKAVQKAASWLQSAWTKTENLRSLMADGFKTAIDNGRRAINTTWAAVKTLAGWIQTAWDKSDTLRSLLAGSFKTAVNGIKSAFNFAKTAANNLASAIQKIIDKAGSAASAVSSIPGAGAIGGIIGGVFHDGGYVGGSANAAPKDIPIMAQGGEYVMSRAEVAAAKSGVGVGSMGSAGGTPVHIHLFDKYEIEAIVSARDAELLAGLESGVRG